MRRISGFSTFSPWMDTCPLLAFTKPATVCSNVVFPQPEGPRRQTNSPLGSFVCNLSVLLFASDRFFYLPLIVLLFASAWFVLSILLIILVILFVRYVIGNEMIILLFFPFVKFFWRNDRVTLPGDSAKGHGMGKAKMAIRTAAAFPRPSLQIEKCYISASHTPKYSIS